MIVAGLCDRRLDGGAMSNAARIAEIDALFARADADDDGQINYAEFRSLVRELDGDDIPDETLRIGFTETDADGNGRINIDEFRAWWLSD
jgi:Ca2+-binding EF-hand superfamily protein